MLSMITVCAQTKDSKHEHVDNDRKSSAESGVTAENDVIAGNNGGKAIQSASESQHSATATRDYTASAWWRSLLLSLGLSSSSKSSSSLGGGYDYDSTSIRLRFDRCSIPFGSNSIALRPFDDLRYDHRPTSRGLLHCGLNKLINRSTWTASRLRHCDLNDLW